MGQMITWDNVMDSALSMPLVKVNRNEFLQKEFASYGNNIDQLCNKRPIDLYNNEIVENVAKDVIKSHLIKVTAVSTVAGIPGGLAMLGTIPADMAQYYWHVLVLAQKLGYIYGWPDLLDNQGKINESTRNVLTLFVGIMLGAQAANKAIGEVAKRFAEQVAKRLPQQALTKTIYYPIIKQVAKWIGVTISKQSFAKGVSKVIPILGGVISGTVTNVTFRPMAKKLQDELRKQMELFKSIDSHYYFEEDASDENIDVEDATFEDFTKTQERQTINLEELKIQACINIAKLDFDLAKEEIDFITNMIDESDDLDDVKKMELLQSIHNKELVDIDFTKIKGNMLYSTALIESLIAIVKIDNIVKPSEKIYLFKIAHDLGFNHEDIKEMIKEQS